MIRDLQIFGFLGRILGISESLALLMIDQITALYVSESCLPEL